MSCHGCRVLRKRCSDNCVLRPCLEWIESPEAKARATLFVSKFFGRSDLINFISSVPSHKRNALFKSLLFEAVGRTVNPVNGAIGLLSTGKWHLCEAAVRTVLAGGTPPLLMNNIQIPEDDCCSGVSQNEGKWSDVMIRNQVPPTDLMVPSSATAVERSFSAMTASNSSKVSMRFRCSDGEEPKLLNLLV